MIRRYSIKTYVKSQGRSQDFSKGGGGHTGSNNLVMAFSPRNIVGCLLKKKTLKKGGGGSRAPQDPPSYALESHIHLL